MIDADRNELAIAAIRLELLQGPCVRFGCAISQQILGEALPGKGLWRERQGLSRRGYLSGDLAGRIAGLLDGKERIAIRPVEEVDESLLGRLHNCVDLHAVALDREERGRRGEIAIPYVMVNALEVPDAFASGRIESQQSIRKQIVTYAVKAVIIRHGRASGNIDDSSLHIESHTAPVVR